MKKSVSSPEPKWLTPKVWAISQIPPRKPRTAQDYLRNHEIRKLIPDDNVKKVGRYWMVLSTTPWPFPGRGGVRAGAGRKVPPRSIPEMP